MRRSYLSNSYSKGQWFLISTVMVSAAFLAISFLFEEYFAVDNSAMARIVDNYYFEDIKYGLNKTVQIFGFSDCSKLETGLDEFIHFSKQRMAKMGYYLFVNKSINCGGQKAYFGILLASDRMVVYENVNPGDIIPLTTSTTISSTTTTSSSTTTTTMPSWLNGWNFRKQINITNTAGNLTDYQIAVDPQLFNTNGLVGSWHFSEGSGTLAKDSSGQNNDGTLTNFNWDSTSNWTNGYNNIGTGLSFDGINDYVNVSDSASLRPSQITVETWINGRSWNSASIYYFVSKGNDDGWNFGVVGTYDAPECSGTNDQGATIVFNGSTTICYDTAISTNIWNHVAFTNDGSTTNLYVNGNLVASGAQRIPSTAGVDLSIGKRSDNYWFFNGTIDEVKIYNRVLSQPEIQQHYNQNKARLDYADMRFTWYNATSGKQQNISYWFEQDNRTWFKVPFMQNNTNTTAYMYYGNANANSTSIFNSTFTKQFNITAKGSSDNTLIGEWHMDTGSGNTIYDSSGQGNNGDMTGHAATWQTSDGGKWDNRSDVNGSYSGFFNGSHLYFNGASAWTKVTSNSFKNAVMSVELWVKTTASSMPYINYVNVDSYYGWQFANQNTGKPYFYFIGSTGGPLCYVFGSTNTADGNWHYLAVTNNGTQLALYVDGKLNAINNSCTPVWTTNMYSYMGCDRPESAGGKWWFSGYIDEARIYNRALSANEIYRLYINSKYAAPDPSYTMYSEEL